MDEPGDEGQPKWRVGGEGQSFLKFELEGRHGEKWRGYVAGIKVRVMSIRCIIKRRESILTYRSEG